ncbi:MAG: hypothetical protein H0U98_13505 [Alphaproteobacteria bacterium]|nr:hypothetical protein [Alphaproteobacteria bacterium]
MPGTVPLPGLKVPPLAIVVLPTVPLPERIAPLCTVTALAAMEPVTFSVPALTVVGPEY